MKNRIPGVLREHPQFARLFLGQSLSVLGDRVTFVAVPFAVLSVGGSATDVGLVAAAGLVPMLLFALVGGVWADRLPRHRIMLVSDLVRCATQATGACLLLTGVAEVPHLALLMVVFGTADAFFMPAATGLVPLILPRERLREANALRGFVHSSGLVLGPVLAGALVAWTGPGGALALDAGTFAVSAAFLARLTPRAVAESPAGSRRSFPRELRTGFREVRTRTWLWAGMGAMSVYHVVVLPSVSVLGPVLADSEWGGARSWAAVVTAFGIGSIAGDVLAYRIRPARPFAVAGAALAVASCQALIIGIGDSVVVIAALEAVTGVAVAVFFTLWETTLQIHVPERSLSRVSSFDHLLSTGLMPLGLVLAGPLSRELGVRPTLYAMTAVAVPVALALLFVPAPARSAPVSGGADRPRTGDGDEPRTGDGSARERLPEPQGPH
ncbi:MFS transporter [Streptomyces sp. GC420]|uniref:MFS transporter n=1 Tax=Streptomyces sp. GC420 TaxID=2697568 RepID=UPI001414F138|nr:MFS transporter [Streptomyces sp. GC420]NBM19259.1 MFS transporter [Streptomyces sp. GC420]